MSTPASTVRLPVSSPENERNRRSRFVRSRRGRLIGGVCSGLGAHFDVDPILFRIAFVGLAIVSGVGIGLYLAILLLVPEEGASRAPIYMRRSSWRIVLGVVVVIAAAPSPSMLAATPGIATSGASGRAWDCSCWWGASPRWFGCDCASPSQSTSRSAPIDGARHRQQDRKLQLSSRHELSRWAVHRRLIDE